MPSISYYPQVRLPSTTVGTDPAYLICNATAVTGPAGGNNTWGAWTQLNASATYSVAVTQLRYSMGIASPSARGAIQIGYGVAGAEVPVWTGGYCGNDGNTNGSTQWNSLVLPPFIPQGARIVARMWNATGGTTGLTGVAVYGTRFDRPFVSGSRVVQARADAFINIAQLSQAAPSITTSATELWAKTTFPFRPLYAVEGNQTAGNDLSLLVGPSGAENVVCTAPPSVVSSSVSAAMPFASSPIIPAGSRLSAKHSSAATAAVIIGLRTDLAPYYATNSVELS